MLSELQTKLKNVSGHRENRQILAGLVLNNSSFYPELIGISLDNLDKNGHKACWILECVSYEKLDWLLPYLDVFCSKIGILEHESSIRPMAKICLLLVNSHFKDGEISLTENQLQSLTEVCFDWLLKDTKVATKCYSMRSLHFLGNHYEWIHPELKIILEKEYRNHSAAYKAVSREILKKIK